MADKYYSVKEIAALEECTERTVYRLIEDGFLLSSRRPSKNKQGRILISETDYKEYKILFTSDVSVNQKNNCPDCGAKLVNIEGCRKCFFCGYSVCGG